MLRRLRAEQASEVPVIMLTARDELPDKITGFRAGADDYLTKPFALPELEVRLEALLRVRRAGTRKRLRWATWCWTWRPSKPSGVRCSTSRPAGSCWRC